MRIKTPWFAEIESVFTVTQRSDGINVSCIIHLLSIVYWKFAFQKKLLSPFNLIKDSYKVFVLLLPPCPLLPERTFGASVGIMTMLLILFKFQYFPKVKLDLEFFFSSHFDKW